MVSVLQTGWYTYSKDSEVVAVAITFTTLQQIIDLP